MGRTTDRRGSFPSPGARGLRARPDADARYRSLVEQIPAVVYIDAVDDVTTASYVSPYYETLLGYTPEERLADPELWIKLLHPEDRDRVVAESLRTNRTGEPFRMEYRMVARDGEVVWVRDEGVMVRDDAGAAVCWQGVLIDVTERKRAEEALHRLGLRNKLILDSAGEGIFGLDSKGRATFVNPATTSMTGWTEQELLGRSLHEVLHHSRPDGTPYPADDCPIYAAFRDGSTHRLDNEVFWRKDGTAFPVEYTSTPIRENEQLVGAVVTFSDITGRKEAEEAFRKAYDREREVTERLRSLDEMKNAFLTAVSHELRTPLSSVLGYALTLEQEDIDLTPDQRRDMLERLAANARKLDRLLSDLLDLDRLSRGIMEPHRQDVDVSVLVRRVVAETELEGRPIQVDAQPLTASVDGPKVERILENLLVNAARHTPAGAAVRVSVLPDRGGVQIRVEDKGPGVPDEMKRTLFRPFERGSRPLGHAPGTGIGLSLVARFAELHGGEAWVVDSPGGGASFRVFLPPPTSTVQQIPVRGQLRWPPASEAVR